MDFRDLYAGTLRGARYSNTKFKVDGEDVKDYLGWDVLYIDADIMPTEGSKKISRNFAGDRFDYITTDSLGESSDFIDAGFIKELTVDNLQVNQDLTVDGTIDCKNINPALADSNLSYNLNIGSINGIDIARYLAVSLTEKYFDLDIKPEDDNATTGPDYWNFDRTSSSYNGGGKNAYVSALNGKFAYTVKGQVEFEGGTPYLSSLVISVASGDMQAYHGSGEKNWDIQDFDDGPDDPFIGIFKTHGNTFMETLADTFGEDAIANTQFPTVDKKSEGVDAADSTDRHIRDHGRCRIRLNSSGVLVFDAHWRSGSNNAWDDNGSYLKNGSAMSLSIPLSFNGTTGG